MKRCSLALIVVLFFTALADAADAWPEFRGPAGGVAVAKAAQLLAGGHSGSPELFCDEIAAAMQPSEPEFADMVRGLPKLLQCGPEKAFPVIAWSGMAKPEFEEPIITPFVIPTVLASSVVCPAPS
jgi:ADP-ribosyl-[dinitrogen reductase] hydrolase